MRSVAGSIALLALVACGNSVSKHDPAPRPADAANADSAPDALVHDAASLDAVVHVDAGSHDAGTPNQVTCYTEGNPAQSCQLPTHCCFTNYSSQHDGACSSGACAYGTIECDGPEDCGSGQHCCSHLMRDENGMASYVIGCQATACGAAPANYELCHDGGPACSNGGSCVTAYLNDNDLPRTLELCQ